MDDVRGDFLRPPHDDTKTIISQMGTNTENESKPTVISQNTLADDKGPNEKHNLLTMIIKLMLSRLLIPLLGTSMTF